MYIYKFIKPTWSLFWDDPFFPEDIVPFCVLVWILHLDRVVVRGSLSLEQKASSRCPMAMIEYMLNKIDFQVFLLDATRNQVQSAL